MNLKEMKSKTYDPNYSYDLMIVTDPHGGPDETFEHISAEEVIEIIETKNLPEYCIYIQDHDTKQLCGLKTIYRENEK